MPRTKKIDASDPRASAIGLAAKEQLARLNLIDFAERMIPGFQSPPHIQLLADRLQRVESGEIRRLLVTLFPGSGKSTLLQGFGSWYLGRNTRDKIIAASAGAELAERNSRASRGLFTDPQ